MCRDCDIHPLDSDNTCIGHDLVYVIHQQANTVDMIKDEFEEYSFLPTTNAFNQQSFGGCDRGIHDATPAELLHAMLLSMYSI